MKTQRNTFLKLICSCLLIGLLFAPCSYAAGLKPIKIHSGNASQFEEVDIDLVCRIDPKTSTATPGRIRKIKKKKNKAQQSNKKTKKKKKKKKNKKSKKEWLSLETERNEKFRKFKKIKKDKSKRAQNLLAEYSLRIEQGQKLCDIGPQIRQAVENILSNAEEPESAIGDYFTLLLTALELIGDQQLFVARVERHILDAFQEKDDFDRLNTAFSNLSEFYTITDYLPSNALAQEQKLAPQDAICGAQYDVNLYFADGGTAPFVLSMANLVQLFQIARSENTVVQQDLTARYWKNPTVRPDSDGAEVCNQFIGLASSPQGMEDSAAVNALPQRMQASAAAYQRAYNRCLQAFGVSNDNAQTLDQWLANAASENVELAEVVNLRDLIAQDITSGRQIILIGHGLGNIAANVALSNISDDDEGSRSTSVAHIALGLTKSLLGTDGLGGFEYITVSGDVAGQVSGAPASTVSSALSSATGVSPTTHRFSAHHLSHSYILQDVVREQLMAKIVEFSQSLKNERPEAGQGFFQVTLEWADPGDIDLHVFEPAPGKHVYWASKNGSSGTLDRDDIPGTGPENYFVCTRGSLLNGTYTVRVNNFSGVQGTQANITIRTGNQVFSFPIIVTDQAQADDGTYNNIAEITYDTSNRNFSVVDTRGSS